MSGPSLEIGGNNPPVPTKLQSILERFTELQATCSAWLTKCPKIETQEQADDCAGFVKQLIALEHDADDARMEEQRPFQAKVNAIREAFRPSIEGTQRMKALLEPKQRAWLQAVREKQERDRREAAEAEALAQKRAKEAAEEAERLTQRAEAGELVDGHVNVAAKINAAAEAEREAEEASRRREEAERAKPKSGGQYVVGGVKRSVGLRTQTTPEVEDLKKAAAYFAKKNNSDLIEAVLKAARAELKGRTGDPPAIPGIKYVTTEKAV